MPTLFKLHSVNGQNNNRLLGKIGGRLRTDYFLVTGQNDPDDIEAAWAAGLPAPGNAGFSDGTIVRECEAVHVFETVAPFSVAYAVRSYSNYDVPQYRRNTRISQAADLEMQFANWTRYVVSGSQQGPIAWLPAPGTPHVFRRSQYYRIDTRVVAGVTPEQVITFDSTNVGRWTEFGSIGNQTLYKYQGTDGTFGADGFGILRSVYLTNAKVQGVPAGTYAGWDVAIPELPPLAEYVTRAPNGAVAPSIGVRLFQSWALQMEPVPW